MDADDFITLSTRKEVIPAGGVPPQAALQGSLSVLTETLRERGCTLVGHIKGMVEDGGSPPLFFSITSLAGEVKMKGGPLKSATRLVMSMTVIVAGITAEDAGASLEDALAEHFKPAWKT